MAEAFSDQIKQPAVDSLSFEERFGLIVDRHWTWKENNRMQRYLKNAHLKLNAAVEDIDYKTPRGIDQSVMMSLIACEWVRRHHNILITGPTGAGKTFIACALTNKACREGYRALYIRSPKFFYQMALAKGDGSYGSFMKQLSKAHVLVLDDLGVAPMSDIEREETSWRSSRSATATAPPLSPVRSPWITGTNRSETLLSPTPSLTG